METGPAAFAVVGCCPSFDAAFVVLEALFRRSDALTFAGLIGTLGSRIARGLVGDALGVLAVVLLCLLVDVGAVALLFEGGLKAGLGFVLSTGVSAVRLAAAGWVGELVATRPRL